MNEIWMSLPDLDFVVNGPASLGLRPALLEILDGPATAAGPVATDGQLLRNPIFVDRRQCACAALLVEYGDIDDAVASDRDGTHEVYDYLGGRWITRT